MLFWWIMDAAQHKLPISIKVRNFVAMENFRP